MNGSRILLVEDGEDIGAELTQALAGGGHLPSLARTGAEALTAATLTPPDLVLLDLGLPDIDGVELCRRLRASLDAQIGLLIILSTYYETRRWTATLAEGVASVGWSNVF